MIIFLFGEDSYRSREKLNEIIGEYKKVRKHGLNLEFMDCEEEKVSIQGLLDKTRQATMFKEKKLIVLANLFKDAGFKESFQKLLKDFQNTDDIIILYESNNIKKTDSLFKALQKGKIKFQEFKLLENAQRRVFVGKLLAKMGAKIDPQALEILLANAGEDLWQLANESQKLAAFKRGKEIMAADVRLMSRPKIETDIFKTIDAIAQKNKAQALALLQKHVENGDAPIYLLSMVSYQIRNLLIIKELTDNKNSYDAIAKKSGLHPFVVRKTYSLANRFTTVELKKICHKIFEADLGIKVGKIDPEMALELLIAGL